MTMSSGDNTTAGGGGAGEQPPPPPPGSCSFSHGGRAPRPRRQQQQQRRRRPPPGEYALDVPLATARHAAGAAELLAAFVRHIAFAREQAHAPFQQLAAHVAGCRDAQAAARQQGRAARLPAASRRAIKYHDSLAALLQAAAAVPFARLRGGADVAVVLGPSVLRPREVYVLQFPPSPPPPPSCSGCGGGGGGGGGAGATGQPPPPPSERAVGDDARRLLRALVTRHCDVDEWGEAPGATRMFLLYAPRCCCCCCPSSSSSPPFSGSDGDALPADDAAPPRSFVARRGLSLAPRRGFTMRLRLGAAGEGGGGGGGSDQAVQPPPPPQPQPPQRQPQPAGGGGGGGQQQQRESLDALSRRLAAQVRLADGAGPTAAAAAAAAAAGGGGGGAAGGTVGCGCGGSSGAREVWYQAAAHARGMKRAPSSS